MTTTEETEWQEVSVTVRPASLHYPRIQKSEAMMPGSHERANEEAVAVMMDEAIEVELAPPLTGSREHATSQWNAPGRRVWDVAAGFVLGSLLSTVALCCCILP
jgi:hypothetical protein